MIITILRSFISVQIPGEPTRLVSIEIYRPLFHLHYRITVSEGINSYTLNTGALCLSTARNDAAEYAVHGLTSLDLPIRVDGTHRQVIQLHGGYV